MGLLPEGFTPHVVILLFLHKKNNMGKNTETRLNDKVGQVKFVGQPSLWFDL